MSAVDIKFQNALEQVDLDIGNKISEITRASETSTLFLQLATKVCIKIITKSYKVLSHSLSYLLLESNLKIKVARIWCVKQLLKN